jgi:hypothetical protein
MICVNKRENLAEFSRFPKVLNFRLRKLKNFSLKWPNLKVCLVFSQIIHYPCHPRSYNELDLWVLSGLYGLVQVDM